MLSAAFRCFGAGQHSRTREHEVCRVKCSQQVLQLARPPRVAQYSLARNLERSVPGAEANLTPGKGEGHVVNFAQQQARYFRGDQLVVWHDILAGGDPLGEKPVGLRVHILVRAKPEKEQERGRRAEKRVGCASCLRLRYRRIKERLIHKRRPPAPTLDPPSLPTRTLSAGSDITDGSVYSFGNRHRGAASFRAADWLPATKSSAHAHVAARSTCHRRGLRGPPRRRVCRDAIVEYHSPFYPEGMSPLMRRDRIETDLHVS